MKAKQKVVITAVSFGLLNVIFLVVVVYVVLQGVLEDRGQVLVYKHELLQLQEDEKSSRELEMFSTQYEGEFVRFEDLLVDSETPIAFFRFLDETADLFRLRIEKAPGAVQHLKGDRWPSFEIRLAGDGVYPDVMAFLQKIENGPYLLEIKTFTLTTEGRFTNLESQGEVEFISSWKVFTR